MRRLPIALLVWLAAGCSKPAPPPPDPTPIAPTWQLVAHGLPSALLSVDGTSERDIYAVGSDKGAGPLVVHFDGTTWKTLSTNEHADLWWVHAFPGGTAIMSGASATVLRYSSGRFERLPTPGLGKQTVYGVWGPSPDDFYAVGSSAGRDGFVWHYKAGAFSEEVLPLDLPRLAHDEVPGFFKVWGRGDDVWVVGAAGSILHKRGARPFARVPSGTTETLFTVHGTEGRVVTVGGGSNAVALEGLDKRFLSVAPVGAPLMQGIYTFHTAAKDVDWASGERGVLYTRQGTGPFQAVDHELAVRPGDSLHAVYVDPTEGVWSVGGDVLTPALNEGMMIHYGKPVPPLTLPAALTSPPPPATCSDDVVAAGRDKSIARRWDEQALAAIRLDIPRPTLHARNLFHLSAAMWDAWAAYDKVAVGVFDREKLTAVDVGDARKKAISYAAYRILKHRYEHANGGPVTTVCLARVMSDLGYDPSDLHDRGEDPIALGNRISAAVIAATLHDGSGEEQAYVDPAPFKSPNAPLIYDNPGTTMADPNVWQPINLSVAATQNGIVLPAGVQDYIGSQWDAVTPFAMTRTSTEKPWHDPGPTPRVGREMKQWLLDVIQKSAAGDVSDGVMMDISPGAYGNNTLGTNDGKGWAKNPVTGEPYPPQVVPRADFARVMAEFWADGPKSETPPGHWNVLANLVHDHPAFTSKLYGKGEPLDPLSWDVHTYLALNGAVHDAAVTAWGIKRRTVSSRPICLIRWMGAKGQSSDPHQPAYDPDGLPLVPGMIEVVTKESSAPGQRHAQLAFHQGEMAVRGWPGEPGDRAVQDSGVRWMRAVDWVPYQRRNFVTPAFPGFISGHSTFSRAGAEVLTAMTGSPFFPGGYAEYVAPANTFLQFERGPSKEVHLGWAAYADAADQAGQSRLWGGIHIAPDDFVGRRLGAQVGKDAIAKARTFFDGTAPPP